jgi:hypothetical protein
MMQRPRFLRGNSSLNFVFRVQRARLLKACTVVVVRNCDEEEILIPSNCFVEGTILKEFGKASVIAALSVERRSVGKV